MERTPRVNDMPLPDANKKSPRVYTNLQNLDLDNVTFANVQATGNPIAVEEMNEDEMRRLVLVNLARLVCAGEWSGLLTAGGGGDFNAELPGESIGDASSKSRYPVGSYAPYGTGDITTFAWYANDNADKTLYYPFIAGVTGTVTEFGVQVTVVAGAACNLLIGIYSDDGNGNPETLQMSAEIDVENSGTGSIYQTSITADVSDELTRGTQYWVAMNRDTTSVAFTLKAFSPVGTPNVAPTATSSLGEDDSVVLRTIDKPLALVATESLTNLGGTNTGKNILTMKVS